MTENDYCLLYDIASKRITELEKENTELKDDNKVMADNYSKMEQKFYDNLTKAKEVIKSSIVLLTKSRTALDTKTYLMKAEQFLRDIDIDNAIQKANENLDLDKIADEVEQDLNESCPDVLCKDCNKEDCIARKLGLIC